MTATDTKPAAPAPRLVGFRVRPDAALPRPLDRIGLVNMQLPEMALVGWSVHVRGSVVFFISPRGWKYGQTANTWPRDGKLTIVGPVPMSSITLSWEADSPDAVDKLQRYDSPPMQAPKPVGDELPQIDPKELGDP